MEVAIECGDKALKPAVEALANLIKMDAMPTLYSFLHWLNLGMIKLGSFVQSPQAKSH